MLMVEMKIELADLFLLFIYAEIIGMVGAFYASNRIPVTLPIIAITALCRLIVLHSKEADPLVLVAEGWCYCYISRCGIYDESKR